MNRLFSPTSPLGTCCLRGTSLLTILVLLLSSICITPVHADEISYSLSELWVGAGDEQGRFNHPVDVFIDKDERVLVADYYNNRIQVFNQNSQLLAVWTGFNAPEKIAQDSIGNFYIADTNNHRIVKLKQNGEFISAWSDPLKTDFFPRGVGVAVSPDNYVYVVQADDYIFKYDSNGQLVPSWGNNGMLIIDANFEAVRVDSHGFVYVLGNNTVIKLSSTGQQLAQWGSFAFAQDLFIDAYDNVFITNTGAGRVEKYSKDGQLLTMFGSGILNTPHGSGVDRRGRVYVADARNNRIVVFTPSTPPPFILDTPLMKQTDAKWATVDYDHANVQPLACGKTIGECGCALSSLAMMLNYHGVTKDPEGNATSPATLNNYFNQNAQCGSSGCISQGYAFGDVLWSAADRYSADANRNFGTQKIVSLNGVNDTKWDPEIVSQDIKNGNPVIIQTYANEHWAIATGIDQDTFVINDPLYTVDRLNLLPYHNIAYAIRRFKKTSSDFSSLELRTKLPGKISVIDPLGREIGDIPNTHISTGHRQSTNTVTIGTPIAGEYTVTNTSSSSVIPLAVYATNKTGGLKFKLFEQKNPFMESRSYQYKFIYDPNPISDQLKLHPTIDIQPHVKNNVGFCTNSSLMVSVAVLSSDTFEANQIDDKTVFFHGAKNTFRNPVTQQPYHLTQDVNHDGKADAVFNFPLKETTLTCSSTSGVLSGKLKDGIVFVGTDQIQMFGAKPTKQ